MLVMECRAGDGVIVHEARRFTDGEKKSGRYTEWFAEIGLVAVGDTVCLEDIDWRDDLVEEICSRAVIGWFCGSDRAAWEISESEKAELITRDAKQRAERETREPEELGREE